MAKIVFRVLIVAAFCAGLSACASSRNLDSAFTDLGANAELKSVLFSDRSHDYSDIDLTIYEGRLLLTGTMRSEEGRKKLVENARTAETVNQVIDAIVVGERTSIGQWFEDTRIDQTLRAKLIADKEVASGDYKIAVSGAIVHLIGATRSKKQLDRTLQLASTTAGVEKVVTYVEVRDSNVKP